LNIPKKKKGGEESRRREKRERGEKEGGGGNEGRGARGGGEGGVGGWVEKTSRTVKAAMMAAAAKLLSAQNPVISVNGNVAALCPKEIVQLAKATQAKIEVNLFYYDEVRKKKIEKSLKKAGAKQVLGTNPRSYRKIGNLDSPRRIVDKDGIFAADVVLVPLEDGDRTEALQKMGKTVITFDLNPLSRTAQKADITIVDNVIRGMKLLVSACKKPKSTKTNFNNRRALSSAVSEIKNNLSRRGSLA